MLIIEFHRIRQNLSKIKKFLLENKFKIIHIHGNNFGGIDKNGNPNVMEVTFINPRKFKVSKHKSNFKYPIPGLDFRNFKRANDIILNFDDR